MIMFPAIEGGKPVRKKMLQFSPPYITGDEIKAVRKVLKSGWITTGKINSIFEKMLSDYLGTERTITLNSATAGLFLILRICGIGNGDEVITTPYTFGATANVIVHTGATPVFADIEYETFNIDPAEVEKKITDKTKAIIAVHYGGNPARLSDLKALAEKYKLLLIEDSAHAIGARYNGKKIGSFGNPCVFSFHAVKNITTAEGGAITGISKEQEKELRIFTLHGQTRDAWSKINTGNWQYDIVLPGYKFNLTDIQAAIGIAQLRKIEFILKRREEIANFYNERLSEINIVKIPNFDKKSRSSFHLYPLRIDFPKLKINKSEFITALRAENISTNVHYIPLHMMSYYKKRFNYKPEDFPASLRAFKEEVSLPIYPLMRIKDAEDVVNAVEKIIKYYRK